MKGLTYRFLWDQFYEFNRYKNLNHEEYKAIDEFIMHCFTVNNHSLVTQMFTEQNKMRTYLMKDLNTGLYKIGRSKNPAARESTLQSEKPTIKMVKVWEEDIEKELHRMYEKERVRGEWFNLSEIQVKFITSKP